MLITHFTLVGSRDLEMHPTHCCGIPIKFVHLKDTSTSFSMLTTVANPQYIDYFHVSRPYTAFTEGSYVDTMSVWPEPSRIEHGGSTLWLDHQVSMCHKTSDNGEWAKDLDKRYDFCADNPRVIDQHLFEV